MDTVEIQNIPFANYSMAEFLQILEKRLVDEQKTFVVTANPEIVMYANKDKQYYKALAKADFIVPDGIGVVIASKILKNPLKERVAGFDLMGNLLKLAAKKNLRVYFLGAKEKTVEKTVNNIQKTHPGLQIVGYHHGYFDIDDEKIATTIAELKPDLVFVALGYPKQEFWIERYLHRFDKGIFMGVGGSFDIWAGEAKRAPDLWIKLHLEWLYRIIQEPKRIKRMSALPRFMLRVLFMRK